MKSFNTLCCSSLLSTSSKVTNTRGGESKPVIREACECQERTAFRSVSPTRAGIDISAHYPILTYIQPSHLLAPCSFTDDSDFLTIVTCCLCSLIITSALLVYGSFKVSVLGCLFDCNSLTSFQRRRCRRWRQHFINSALFSHSALRCENVK